MATYVICHGAWEGGWAYGDVAALLRAAGHEVYTPTYTGLGERRHLLSREIDLNTHIQDVLMVLHYEDLKDVVLVGHSYGGMVISGVAEEAAERLSRLVYLDAFVPQDGQSVADIVGPEELATLQQAADAEGDGWRVPLSPPDVDRRTAQPIGTFLTPVRITSPAAAALPRTFIYCAKKEPGESPFFTQAAEMARADDRWRYRELSAGHEIGSMDKPQELVDLLLEIA